MRILITGGRGFVGGRAAVHLMQLGHEIVIGSRNLEESLDCLPHAEVVNTDWDNPDALARICQGVDVVIHAAGMNSQECAADPVAALKFNGLATARLAQMAALSKVKRFIYISTCHVYASPLVGLTTEQTRPLNLHPYATSHLAGESAVLRVAQMGKIQGLVVRLSNAFGALIHNSVNCWMLLVNDLCRQAVEKGNLTLNSSGFQHRDFIPMTDFCNAIENLVIRKDLPKSPAILNLGSGRSQAVRDVAKIVQSRFKVVLGYTPDLHCQDFDPEQSNEKLEYGQQKYHEFGNAIQDDKLDEIDGLLSYCSATFDHHVI